MGGPGSGRKPQGAVRLVEQAIRLDLRLLVRASRRLGARVLHLTWPAPVAAAALAVLDDDRLLVFFAGRMLSAPMALKKTPSGGRYPTLLCPGCAREVCHLYVGVELRCRRCMHLLYESQLAAPAQRRRLRFVRLARALESRSQAETGASPRPKGMWRRRYLRLLEQLLDAGRQLRAQPEAGH
jgi:hypothetical protein